MAANLYVVDTSVVGAWFIKDEFSGAAERFRDAIIDSRIQVSCPDFLLLELVNMLLWKYIPGDDILAAVRSITEVTLDFIPLTSVNSELLIRLALSHKLTSYDALYFALAEQLDAQLVSADGQLLKAAGSRGVHINDFQG